MGVDASGITSVANRTMPQNLRALARGQVAQLFEPYASMAVRLGLGDIVYAASARKLTYYTTLLALRPTVQRLRLEFAAMRLASHRPSAMLVGRAQSCRSGLAGRSLLCGHRASGSGSRIPQVQGGGSVGQRHRGHERWIPLLAVRLRSGGFISRLPDYDDCVADAVWCMTAICNSDKGASWSALAMPALRFTLGIADLP